MWTQEAIVFRNEEWTGLERFLGPDGLEELRKPLWTVMAATHALQREGSLGARERRLVERIDESVARVLAVIRDLVDGHALEQGRKLVLHRRPTDVRAVLARVAEAARIDHPGRAIWSALGVAGVADWDGDRVEQMLSTAVDQAMRVGTPDATLLLRARDVAGDAVEVEVEVAHADGVTGFGDSLPFVIARHVARAHGGRLSVRRAGADALGIVVRLPRGGRRSRSLVQGDAAEGSHGAIGLEVGRAGQGEI